MLTRMSRRPEARVFTAWVKSVTGWVMRAADRWLRIAPITMVTVASNSRSPTVSKSVRRESARASLKAFCKGPSDNP